jgi:uncharacterized LabA/DUF88 family protein
MMTTPKTNYIFIDYENVQQVDLTLIKDKPVKVVLVVGLRQRSLPFELVQQVHALSAQVGLIRVELAAKQALDMVLAYEVGAQVKTDSAGCYTILSKDQDFDSLVAHLKAQGVQAFRAEVFADIPVLMNAKLLTISERHAKVVERLDKLNRPGADGRPKRKKTLCSLIDGLFFKQLNEAEVERLVNELEKRGYLEIEGEVKVTYATDDKGA